LWIIPGLAVILYTGFWLGLVLAALCARFRDIPQVVSSMVQVVFFMTPIMWKPELLSGRPAFVKENPFYHFIELLRAPLLGNEILPETWMITLGCAAFGSLAAFFVFARLRRRVAFWV
jgi:ABC-2 type transport system permease protein/lipopolysaccharide transport system permease protein